MESKILIADDESDIVSMLGSFFESKGFRVLPAFNGAEALKQVEKQPDIILLDINMPGTDGLEVCKRIRDHISCPILFLTARIEDTDKAVSYTHLDVYKRQAICSMTSTPTSSLSRCRRRAAVPFTLLLTTTSPWTKRASNTKPIF